MTPEAAAAVRAYNAAIAAPPAARAAGQRAPLTPGTGALAVVPDEDDFMHDASPPKQIRYLQNNHRGQLQWPAACPID